MFVLRGLLFACFDYFAVAYMFIACCFLVAYCDLLCWLRLLGCGLECDALIVLVTCFIVFGVVCYVVLTSWGFVGFGVALFVLVVWVWCLLRLRWWFGWVLFVVDLRWWFMFVLSFVCVFGSFWFGSGIVMVALVLVYL